VLEHALKFLTPCIGNQTFRFQVYPLSRRELMHECKFLTKVAGVCITTQSISTICSDLVSLTCNLLRYRLVDSAVSPNLHSPTRQEQN
jgi:hypothetical protein